MTAKQVKQKQANGYLWIPSNRAPPAPAPPTYGHGWEPVPPACVGVADGPEEGEQLTALLIELCSKHCIPMRAESLLSCPWDSPALSSGPQIFPPVLNFSSEGFFFFHVGNKRKCLCCRAPSSLTKASEMLLCNTCKVNRLFWVTRQTNSGLML